MDQSEISFTSTEELDDRTHWDRAGLSSQMYDRAIGNGCNCPTCNQYVKIYNRQLSSSMTYALILIAKEMVGMPLEEYIHVENFLKATVNIASSIRGDVPKLCHYGLLERAPGKREDGSSRNGYYRVTAKGIAFVAGKLEVPRYVILYNNKVLGFSGETINVIQALKGRFNYQDLMG